MVPITWNAHDIICRGFFCAGGLSPWPYAWSIIKLLSCVIWPCHSKPQLTCVYNGSVGLGVTVRTDGVADISDLAWAVACYVTVRNHIRWQE